MMRYYHGSTVPDLTTLQPFASPHSHIKEPRVYLTTNRQLATHYIWDTERCPVRSPMLDVRDDGTLVFQEMFSGALAYFYKDLRGFIYRCEGDWPVLGVEGMPSGAMVDVPVPIVDVEVVEDVYDHIRSYEKEGKFRYERFEDLPQYRYDIIRGIVLRKIIQYNLLDTAADSRHVAFVQDKFPRYWQEAKVLAREGLLP